MLKSTIGKFWTIVDTGITQKYTIPYTAKLSREKTFAVVRKLHYSLENFCCASGRGHHEPYTASDSRGKLLRLTKKLQKLRNFSPSKQAYQIGISLKTKCANIQDFAEPLTIVAIVVNCKSFMVETLCGFCELIGTFPIKKPVQLVLAIK